MPSDPKPLDELLKPAGCACPGCARGLEMVRRLELLSEWAKPLTKSPAAAEVRAILANKIIPDKREKILHYLELAFAKEPFKVIGGVVEIHFR